MPCESKKIGDSFVIICSKENIICKSDIDELKRYEQFRKDRHEKLMVKNNAKIESKTKELNRHLYQIHMWPEGTKKHAQILKAIERLTAEIKKLMDN